MLKKEREISEKRVKKMHMPFGKLSFNVKIRSVMAFIPHNLTERIAYTQNMCNIQRIMCKWMIMCFFSHKFKSDILIKDWNYFILWFRIWTYAPIQGMLTYASLSMPKTISSDVQLMIIIIKIGMFYSIFQCFLNH